MKVIKIIIGISLTVLWIVGTIVLLCNLDKAV